MNIMKPTADFFGAIFIPMFKVVGVIFLLIAIVLGSVILWQKNREKQEYREYLSQINNVQAEE